MATERTKCAACGSPNRAGRKFCAECGAALGLSCPNCGAANEPGEHFCGECGTRLDDAVALERAPAGCGGAPARVDPLRRPRRLHAALRGARFAAAADILREIERPFDLAVVRLEHAEWLAADGRLDDAEPLVAEAHEIFERLRAAPYLERLERLSAGAKVAT